MAEVTTTHNVVHGIYPATSRRGPKIWTALITSQSALSVVTGLDRVDAVNLTLVAAKAANQFPYVSGQPAAGTIVFVVSVMDPGAAIVSSTSSGTFYATVIGRVN